jgi:hypothetical protein
MLFTLSSLRMLTIICLGDFLKTLFIVSDVNIVHVDNHMRDEKHWGYSSIFDVPST